MNIFRWLPIVRRLETENAALRKEVERRSRQAQELRRKLTDYIVEQLPECNKDEAQVRAKLKIDQMTWMAAKLKPEVHGERINCDVAACVDIGDALAGAMKRGCKKESEDGHL
jgi:hypothetical protein